VSRAKAVVVEENVLEVRLTSEDTGAYGRDIDVCIPTYHIRCKSDRRRVYRVQLSLTLHMYVFRNYDLQTDIAILVNKVAEELAAASRAEGAFAMLKVGMTNPPYMLEHIERIA
jgi:hypothetical protein